MNAQTVRLTSLLAAWIAWIGHTACQAAVPSTELSGGATTVYQNGQNAFSLPLANISITNRRAHVVGNSFFNKNWVAAPGSPRARDGLGPLFNARSCSACHRRDGRGLPPRSDLKSLLIRISLPASDGQGSTQTHPLLGDQLATQAIPGAEPEGSLKITYEPLPGTFPDGEAYRLQQPHYQITLSPANPKLEHNLLMSPRLAPPVFGLGLLEAIPDDRLRELADPNDTNQDGISGRYNLVGDKSQSQRLGRFGWKANQPTLVSQIAAAFLGDLGITSRHFPDEALTPTQKNRWASLPSGGEPELSDHILNRILRYQQTLAPPARRGIRRLDVQHGGDLFVKVGCHQCHRPTHQTGRHSEVAELSFQTIHPYTDLLLHDMGPALADHRPDQAASGSEWRTPPLWGIGLTRTVTGEECYLHDGRARSLQEAILWHGGEAATSQTLYRHLPRPDRQALLAFLSSL